MNIVLKGATLVPVLNSDGTAPTSDINYLYLVIGKKYICKKNNFLTNIIGLSLLIYIFENYARSRQMRNYCTNIKPKELEKVKAVKDEDFKKAQEHSKDVLAFSMYKDYNDIILETIVWAFMVPAFIWNLSA